MTRDTRLTTVGWGVVLLAAFILLRLLTLLSSPHLSEYEETRMGSMALELLDGPALPYPAYLSPHEAHEAGMLLNGAAIAVLYRIFGVDGVSLKLTWLLYSAAALAALYLMIASRHGTKTALLAGSLYILPPPLFIWHTLADTAVDSGAMLATTLLMGLFIARLPLRSGSPRSDWFLVGLAAGAGVAYSHYCLFIIVTAVAYQCLAAPGASFNRRAGFALAGFIAGSAPWLLLNATQGLSWFEYIRLKLAKSSAPDFAPDIVGFFTAVLPDSLSFKDIGPIPGSALNHAYVGVAVLAVAGACAAVLMKERVTRLRTFVTRARDPRNSHLMVFMFTGILLAALAATGFRPVMDAEREYRYFLLLYPGLCWTAAVCISSLLRQPRLRLPAVLAFMFLLALGAAGTCSLMRPSVFPTAGSGLYRHGSDLWLSYKILSRLDTDREAVAGTAAALRAHPRYAGAQGAPVPGLAGYPELRPLLSPDSVDASYFDRYAYGLGRGAARVLTGDSGRQQQPSDMPAAAGRAAGEKAAGMLAALPPLLLDLYAAVPPPMPAFKLREYSALHMALYHRLPPPYRQRYIAGLIDEAIDSRSPQTMLMTAKFIRMLPKHGDIAHAARLLADRAGEITGTAFGQAAGHIRAAAERGRS